MIVDFMLHDENLGYHDENWKARRASGVIGGNTEGSDTSEGMGVGKKKHDGGKARGDEMTCDTQTLEYFEFQARGCADRYLSAEVSITLSFVVGLSSSPNRSIFQI